MSNALRACLPVVLALTILLAISPTPAFAISHGCTPPTDDIDDISIDISLDGRKSRVSGTFCAALERAEATIMRSGLNEQNKQAALQTLVQLQNLAASQGRAAAGKKVTGSFGCSGTVNTGSSGKTTATGSCGFQINF